MAHGKARRLWGRVVVGQPKLSIKLLQFLVVGGRLNLVQCLGSPNSPHYRISDPLRVGLFFLCSNLRSGMTEAGINVGLRIWREPFFPAPWRHPFFKPIDVS